MRILLVGQAAFAADVLAGLLAAGDEVAALVCPPDKGERVDPVKAAALERGIPVHQFRSLKTPEARAAWESARADLGVLAYVTQIVPAALIDVPRLGTICFHPSLLPRNRGGSAVGWQLIQGAARTGVTVFWTDAGIDTGPILLQREAAVGPDDTAGSLYYQTLYPLGVRTTLDAVALVRAGNPPRLPQDESRATYEPLLSDAHAAIDWSKPRQAVHDLVRGCDPQPGAFTTWNGATLRLFDPRRVDATAEPGTVVALDAAGITVATAGGAIRCARARATGAKAPAEEVARALGITPGVRLGA